MTTARWTAITAIAVFSFLFSCLDEKNEIYQFSNPVFTEHENTSVYFHEGEYFYVTNRDGKLFLRRSGDPTEFADKEPHVACHVEDKYGLVHLWHPQIVNIRGAWYIYFSGDMGNTDDHQLYVLENRSKDPFEGEFEFRGRISTDPDDNWAIHSYTFEHDGQLYMVWSGWESRRIFAETQCIFIARMENPWTLSSDRVKLSEPEYEWERQWVNPGGYKPAYPIYVNEAPFFFASERTDRLYIFYSASAMWTPYYAIGQLSASKGSDILDAASWEKSTLPVFSQNIENSVFGPGYPFIIPSPDSEQYFLLYLARSKAENPYERFSMTVRMQEIEFSGEGKPLLGEPVPLGKVLVKPSGL